MSLEQPITWQPLLTGALAERAERAVEEICEALRPAMPSERKEGADLLAHHALLDAYLTVAWGREEHHEAVGRFLDAAIEQLAETPMWPSLYGGFTGVAWVVEHLQHPPFAPESEPLAESEDPNTEIDAALLTYLNAPVWKDPFDLTSGLVGLGIYALERLPRPAAVSCLDRVVEHLRSLSREIDGDLTWWTPPELVAKLNREANETGHFNLGVAHGVPGVIGLLAQVATTGQLEQTVRPMLSGAVSWLLKQQLPKDKISRFAHTTGGNSDNRPSRAAWCYGDPGIAATLMLAARGGGSREWELEAIAIGASAARRDQARCGVVDAGLCHGAAGLAHLYNRLFQATGEGAFADAARSWFERTLEMRKAGEGVAGFTAWHPINDPAVSWKSNRDFLTGAIGVALALLGAISPVEPLWDRLLLASVRPTLR